MSRAKKQEERANQLARAVAEVEALTASDVVLVLKETSGSYRDINLMAGLIAAFAWLCFLVYSPWDFDPLWFPAELLIIVFVAFRVAKVCDLARYWPCRARRQRQVRAGAHDAFMANKVAGTQRRLGILVYVSRVERAAAILPDRNAAARLEPSKLVEFEALFGHAWSKRKNPETHVGEVLRTLGSYLLTTIPADAIDKELPDHPVIDVEDAE